MKKGTKILIAVLAIFIVGMTMGCAFSEPVSAKKVKTYDGYKGHIKSKTWKKLKKEAKKNYKKTRHSAYSNHYAYVKFHKGHSYFYSPVYATYHYGHLGYHISNEF